jgi:hypothetical protein
MIRRLFTAVLTLSTLCVAVPAFACGGFFCFQQPVDQSAERILYIVDEDAVTLHVQISYTGDDKQFSWVLPLAKAPAANADGSHFNVGSDAVFSILEQATAPTFQYTLDPKAPQNCYIGGGCYAEDAGGPGGGPSAGGGNGVTVLVQESVGPYDAVVIQGSTGKDVSDWLNANQYVQPASALPLLDAYAKQGNVFLGLKLSKDKGAGDLVPIVVKIAEPGPCLPIRLTQIAAQPDMPIVAWVLAAKRAIPKNFLHVVVNEAVVDWLQYGANYKTVVSKAVDQGSGHAFATEYAQPTSDLKASGVQFANPNWNPSALAGISTPTQFMQAMLNQGFSGTNVVRSLFQKYIPKPAEFATASDQEFYSCIQNGSSYPPCDGYLAAVKKQAFDSKGFAADLDKLVVQPMQGVQNQFYAAGRYLTRLYTTMSPEEMTKDPIFAYNGDLPTVDRKHTAVALPICEGTLTTASHVQLTFTDGHQVTVDVPKPDYQNCYYPGYNGSTTSTQPIVAAGGQPAKAVEVLDESGPPYEVQPLGTADLVDAELNNAKLGSPSLTDDFKNSLPAVTWDPYKLVVQGTTRGVDAGGTTEVPTPTGTTTTATSCQAGPVGAVGALAGLIVALALVLRRRFA